MEKEKEQDHVSGPINKTPLKRDVDRRDVNTSGKLSDTWKSALKIGTKLDGVIPIRGKEPYWSNWQNRGRTDPRGIKEYARECPTQNYGVVHESTFSLDIDVEGWAAFQRELKKLKELFGDFTPRFTVVTGRERYHVYGDAKGLQIPTQKLTDYTQLRGYHSCSVGVGSIHPHTGKPYRICDAEGMGDPSQLTQFSDEQLNRWASKREAYNADTPDTERTITFNIGAKQDARVLDLPHPPCIVKLVLQGAPHDQEYVQANHTIARYVISTGLTDGDGAAIASEMAAHTPETHPTTKDVGDRVYNFRSCMSSARNNPHNNTFACSYVWGSREMTNGGLCDACKYKPDGSPEDYTEPDIMLAVRAEALRIMREGDPFTTIREEYAQHHKGDREIIELTAVGRSNQNILNSGGVQSATDGASGKGKTHAQRSSLHVTCTDAYLFDGNVSDRVLFYKNDLRDGMCFMFDDTQLSEPLEKAIQRATSNYQKNTLYETLDGDKHVLSLKMPARAMFFLNSVTKAFSEQTDNRMVNVNIDESTAIDEATWEMQAANAETAKPEFPVTFMTRVCREFFVILQEEVGTFYVSIPFASKIEWSYKENRRNWLLFCDLIRGYAALRCFQRPRRGSTVFAVRQDFEDAKRLYRALGAAQKYKLGDKQMRVIQALMNLPERRGSLKDLGARLKGTDKKKGLTENIIRRVLHGRYGDDSGLLGRIEGLTAEKITETDRLSEDASQSVTHYVYEISSDFEPLGMFDTGVISLPEGADVVEDYDVLPLYHDFTTVLPQKWQNLNGDKERVESEIKDYLDSYSTTLHHNITSLPQIPERGGYTQTTHTDPVESGVCVVSDPTPRSERGKVAKGVGHQQEEDHTVEKTENGEKKDPIALCQTHGKTHPPFAMLNDQEYEIAFHHELTLFNMSDERQADREHYANDEDVAIEMINRVCKHKRVSFEDCVNAWGRVKSVRYVSDKLDEIFDRGHNQLTTKASKVLEDRTTEEILAEYNAKKQANNQGEESKQT